MYCIVCLLTVPRGTNHSYTGIFVDNNNIVTLNTYIAPSKGVKHKINKDITEQMNKQRHKATLNEILLNKSCIWIKIGVQPSPV